MKNGRGDDSKNFIFIAILVIVLEIAIVVAVDFFRVKISVIPHNFSGETWFSVIATIVASLPGLICGIIALIQTKRIQVIEDRLNRPVLLLQQAELALDLCARESFDSTRYKSREVRYIEQIKKNMEYIKEGLLSLKLEFVSNSDYIIYDMYIEFVSFGFYDTEGKLFEYKIDVPKAYSQQRVKLPERFCFRNKYTDGKIHYIFKSDIYTGKEQQMSCEFWDKLLRFMDYWNEKMHEYELISTEIGLRVKHQFMTKEKYDRAKLQIKWKVNKKWVRDRTYMHNMSDEGLYTYINK